MIDRDPYGFGADNGPADWNHPTLAEAEADAARESWAPRIDPARAGTDPWAPAERSAEAEAALLIDQVVAQTGINLDDYR